MVSALLELVPPAEDCWRTEILRWLHNYISYIISLERHILSLGLEYYDPPAHIFLLDFFEKSIHERVREIILYKMVGHHVCHVPDALAVCVGIIITRLATGVTGTFAAGVTGIFAAGGLGDPILISHLSAPTPPIT